MYVLVFLIMLAIAGPLLGVDSRDGRDWAPTEPAPRRRARALRARRSTAAVPMTEQAAGQAAVPMTGQAAGPAAASATAPVTGQVPEVIEPARAAGWHVRRRPFVQQGL